MPRPLVHILATAPLSLGYKWLNITALLIASIFPDLFAVALSPILFLFLGCGANG